MLLKFGRRYLLDRFFLVIVGVHVFFTVSIVLLSPDLNPVILLALVYIPLFCALAEQKHRCFDDAVYLVRYRNVRTLFFAGQKELLINLALVFALTSAFFLITQTTLIGERSPYLPMLLMYFLIGEMFLLLKRAINSHVAVFLILFILAIDVVISLQLLRVDFMLLLGPIARDYAYSHDPMSDMVFAGSKIAAAIVSLYVLSTTTVKDHFV